MNNLSPEYIHYLPRYRPGASSRLFVFGLRPLLAFGQPGGHHDVAVGDAKTARRFVALPAGIFCPALAAAGCS